MKPTNNKQAAQASLDERWLPMSKVKTIKEMRKIFIYTDCALCKADFFHSCAECPIYDDENICCKEYEAWYRAYSSGKFTAAHKASLALVKRLQKIAEGGE